MLGLETIPLAVRFNSSSRARVLRNSFGACRLRDLRADEAVDTAPATIEAEREGATSKIQYKAIMSICGSLVSVVLLVKVF